MHLEKQFDVSQPHAEAVKVVARDDTLSALFPDAKTEIIERGETRRTLRAHYRALGREGTATFHFDHLPDGDLRFEKVCDGRVWSELKGAVSFQERGDKTRVRIQLDGRTKSLVPEFTIKGVMQDQMNDMAKALRKLLG